MEPVSVWTGTFLAECSNTGQGPFPGHWVHGLHGGQAARPGRRLTEKSCPGEAQNSGAVSARLRG